MDSDGCCEGSDIYYTIAVYLVLVYQNRLPPPSPMHRQRIEYLRIRFYSRSMKKS